MNLKNLFSSQEETDPIRLIASEPAPEPEPEPEPEPAHVLCLVLDRQVEIVGLTAAEAFVIGTAWFDALRPGERYLVEQTDNGLSLRWSDTSVNQSSVALQTRIADALDQTGVVPRCAQRWLSVVETPGGLVQAPLW